MKTVQALAGRFNTTNVVADFWTPLLAYFSAPIDIRPAESGRVLFTVRDLVIRRGDRIAVLGTNGVGKSAFLAALAGAHRTGLRTGSVEPSSRFNANARLAYFNQTMSDLPLSESPFSFISRASDRGDAHVTAALAKAGFSFAQTRRRISDLSYGERTRLCFVAMKMRDHNFYLLDEPTNHLDVEGQEELETQLCETDVTCILVSHDRYFVSAVATRFLEIKNGRAYEVGYV